MRPTVRGRSDRGQFLPQKCSETEQFRNRMRLLGIFHEFGYHDGIMKPAALRSERITTAEETDAFGVWGG